MTLDVFQSYDNDSIIMDTYSNDNHLIPAFIEVLANDNDNKMVRR